MIQELPQELVDPVCIFYLVLRALDTVEDDMNIPKAQKIPLLRTFDEKISDRWTPTAPFGTAVTRCGGQVSLWDVFGRLKELSYFSSR